MPNLIINDLFIVQPMTSISGYLVYMQYGLGTEKGGVGGRDAEGKLKTVIQNETPFVWGKMDQNRANYTGEAITEGFTAAATPVAVSVAWGPVVKKVFTVSGVEYDFRLTDVTNPASTTVTYGNFDADGKIPASAQTASHEYKVAYKYDNITVPQDELPTLVGHMEGIQLTARARRIAVYYSQLAAFQAKQDYNQDFESTIAAQAKAELQYEIDAEGVYLIKDTADAAVAAGEIDNITWIDEELDTISYSMKAEGFARKIEAAKMAVYKRTRKFMPNWMLVSPDMMTILTFVPGFKEASNSVANGPYLAGNVAGLKVFVSPALGEKVCYLGVLGNDGKTGVGVYAPYMPIVPTQLLGFADGGMEQGFSTLYDMKILNKALLSKITVTNGDDRAAIDAYTHTTQTV